VRGGRGLSAYLAALGALFVLVAAAAAIFVRTQAYADAEKAARQAADFAAGQSSAQIDDSIKQLKTAVGRLAAAPGIAAAFDQPGKCTLSFAGVGAFGAGHLDIVGADGAVVCTSRSRPQPSAGAEYAGADWLSSGLAAPAVAAPVDDTPTGAKALVATAPIGKRGVAAGFVDLASLGPGLHSLYGGPYDLVFLVTTGDGKTVLSRSAGGKRLIYGKAKAAGPGWKVSAGTSRDKALAPAVRLYHRELGVIFAGLIVILIGTVIIYRRITGPIRRLGRAVRAAAEHGGSGPISAGGPAEVVTLTEDFNFFIASVEKELNERLQAEEAKERIQRQLHQSQRLESLGQLAGGIAHDFNNLLGGILSYAKLVEQEAGDQLQSKPGDASALQVLQDVEQIVRATERAAALTHQLLLFGRKEIVKPQVVDVNAVVSDMEKLLQRTIGEHVKLTTELAKPLPPVFIDPGHLEQVMMNLVVNARDAMPEGGLIAIKTSEIFVDEEYAALRVTLEPGHYVSLVVSDTGSGMPREVIAQVFEPFFTTKPKGQGTGLGLATVYGIVNQAGGHMSVYSEEGVGTTMRAYFPVTDAASSGEKPVVPSATPEEAKGETILLVEDEEVVREPTVRFLTRNGYRVLAAAGPDEALAAAAAGHEMPIALLLTDVIMPGMSGKELADRLTASRPHMRVVYISGYPQDVIVHRGIVDPGVVLIEKPFAIDTLLTKVREVLDGKSAE
jgi:hypothetical protein